MKKHQLIHLFNHKNKSAKYNSQKTEKILSCHNKMYMNNLILLS